MRRVLGLSKLAIHPSIHPGFFRYKHVLWILLGTGVQWFEDTLKEVFQYNPPVGILLNDCASIVQSCCYFVCCQNFVLEHVCNYDGKVMVDNLVEYFISCILLKYPPPLLNFQMCTYG